MIKKILFILCMCIIGIKSNFFAHFSVLCGSSAPNVTIWIHGTKLTGSLIAEKMVTFPPGLSRTTSCPTDFYCHEMTQLLSTADPIQFPLEHIYLFGWSGKLNRASRQEAAHELYGEIKTLITSYIRTYGTQPNITLITHSHGGNVALNLAQYAHNTSDFTIKKLVLLGCPIQKETTGYLDSSFFKQIISIHSHIDMVQIADPQKLNIFIDSINTQSVTHFFNSIKQAWTTTHTVPFFSARHFTPAAKLTQIVVYWQNAPAYQETTTLLQKYTHLAFLSSLFGIGQRGLAHVEFILPPFIKKLPWILHQIPPTLNMSNIVEITIAL